jgi:hypothetical protein
MSSPKILHWDLLKELECPVCLEYMSSPIKMCRNGHNICNSCRLRVSTCPTCKEQFINARNITLENIAATIKYPCENREAGCEETFSLNNISIHQSQCLYQSAECPFRKLSSVDCFWTGILSEIGGHVTSEHGNDTNEYTGCFEVSLQNFCQTQRYRKAMLISGRLFYLVWEVSFDTFYFLVFHVGHKDEAEQFMYDIKIGNHRENISITGMCRSYLETKWKVLRPGECVTLHYRTVKMYVNQNADLLCEIEIRRRSSIEVTAGTRQHYVAVAAKITDVSENAWYE